MKKLGTFLSQNKHFYILIIFIPILLWFKYLEITLIPQHIMHSPLDDRIPLVSAFVVFYLLWFPYIAFGLLYTGVHSRTDFYRLVIFLAGGMSAACAVYMLFPNLQNLRPVIPANRPLAVVLRFIYTVDSPSNVCPSIHVINSIGVDAALQHSEAFAAKKFGRPVSFLLMVLICLSTVLIKQHSILDVLWGVVTASLFYLPLYLLPGRKAKRRVPSRSAKER